MHILSFSIQHLKQWRARKKQTRTALQLLALSGVIRRSHEELRYATPLVRISAFRAQPVAGKHPLIQPFPLRSWKHTITFQMKQTWQWVNSLGMVQRKGQEAGPGDVGPCAV